MCLIIALIFSYLCIIFFTEGNYLNASINGIIAIVFIFLLIRNIFKTKQERDNSHT